MTKKKGKEIMIIYGHHSDQTRTEFTIVALPSEYALLPSYSHIGYDGQGIHYHIGWWVVSQ